MKAATLLASLTLASAAFAVASPAPAWLPSQVSINEDFPVPGDNPLYFCSDPADDVLTIENVDLNPNPPEKGKTLSITAKGTLNEAIEDGAKVHLQVKYGLITLINQEADLCEQVKQVDLECPLDKGKLVLLKDVDLPKEIPPGKYTVLADVFTKDNDKITCLTAQVSF
ncbi:uncharacterized protein BDZ99DRAFT_466488 [Mytilinidion resinicola]|uniref:Phosphatidylglycerol/phosphatidylinositol transfer protein n=1 Tax=Mytilinidion resinicola TaxID=574789 RepID=A0A6A6YCC7_9PEZI|nr:uncharacterized protein BDZ99DRAFT_466488 [Mytilinidion resinicola]KAF2805497.1 hypothetical protein BDZ99DRAFT_466488 [Mytilinidion resinicola]